MNWRKNMVLVIGGGSAALLLVAALVMLFHFEAGNREVSGQLASALSRLQQLNNRDPFPSRDNIAIQQENLKAVQAASVELQAALQRGQLTDQQIEPAEFAPLLERVAKRMKQRGEETGVTVMQGATLGFSRYAAGELPSITAIPRLVMQLKAVDAVANLLLQSRITELVSIGREVFEATEATQSEEPTDPRRQRRGTTAAATGPAQASLPPPETNDLYSVERLTVSFTARETAAWDVLNALARSPLFLAVVDVHVQNTLATAGTIGRKAPPAAVGSDQAKALGLQPHFPSHDERVMAGREPVRVDLVLDLYRFSDALKTEATQ